MSTDHPLQRNDVVEVEVPLAVADSIRVKARVLFANDVTVGVRFLEGPCEGSFQVLERQQEKRQWRRIPGDTPA